MNPIPPELRFAAIERDGYKCSKCGKRLHLDVHHISSVSNGGQHLLEKLRTLCRKCHKIIEPGRKNKPKGSSKYNPFTTIRITTKTRSELDRLGDIHEENYNGIIQRLIEHTTKFKDDFQEIMDFVQTLPGGSTEERLRVLFTKFARMTNK